MFPSHSSGGSVYVSALHGLVDKLLSVCLCRCLLTFSAGGCPLTHPVLVCLQTCQTAAVLGPVEEAGAFGSRQHKTHHTELAEKGQDAHQGINKTQLYENKNAPNMSYCLILDLFDELVFVRQISDNNFDNCLVISSINAKHLLAPSGYILGFVLFLYHFKSNMFGF